MKELEAFFFRGVTYRHRLLQNVFDVLLYVFTKRMIGGVEEVEHVIRLHDHAPITQREKDRVVTNFYFIVVEIKLTIDQVL
ncbi:MAG: hypothetical protein KAG26_09370, partial [Methylococcales bacterium]|nr:hypothetical protein [Methylococcales bacterium]